MFILRQKHIDALNAAAEHHFTCRMRDHAIIYFPDQTEGVSNEAILERVKGLIQQARHDGVTGKKDICDFISLCFTVGDELITKQKFAWAKSPLEDKLVSDGRLRMSERDTALNSISNLAPMPGVAR